MEIHHQSVDVQWVGYYKKATKIDSITWPESVDQALCFGWIDGLRKSIDEKSYKIRFTPRKANSHWSKVNIDRVNALKTEGLMQPAGLEAFKKRKKAKSGLASYEQGKVQLDPNYLQQIKSNPAAWTFFKNMPPYLKKNSCWYVMSAKREETRLRRLNLLITCCTENRKLPQFDLNSEK